MEKWTRIKYLPGLPLGADGRRVTASREHIDLSRRAALDGMVLLKNERKALPLRRGTRVALFGKGTFDYVKGGGGSGDVGSPYVHNLWDGFAAHADMASTFAPLDDYYRSYVLDRYHEGAMPGLMAEPELPDALVRQAAAWTDTAVISISRFSGEGSGLNRRGRQLCGRIYVGDPPGSSC